MYEVIVIVITKMGLDAMAGSLLLKMLDLVDLDYVWSSDSRLPVFYQFLCTFLFGERARLDINVDNRHANI